MSSDFTAISNDPMLRGVQDQRHVSYYSNLMLEGRDKGDPKKVGGLFEAMFYRIIFQQMRTSAISEDVLMPSSAGKYMQEMYHNEMANLLGNQGKLGVVDLVVDASKKQQKAEIDMMGLVKDQIIGEYNE